MMQLMFKDISGYEGLYQISNTGIVKSLSRRANRILNGFRSNFKVSEKIMISRYDAYGYKIIDLYKHGIRKTFKVHRLVLLAFSINPKNKFEVNHKDGNKSNNFIDNLEWVTSSENKKHAFKNGLMNMRGEKHNNRKLNESDVKEIRDTYNNNSCIETKKRMAEKYNVSYRNIVCIVNHESWTHI